MRPLIETGALYRPNEAINESVYYKNIITLTDGNGKKITIRDDDIWDRPTLEKSICSGESITVGGGIIGTLSFTLYDAENAYKNTVFSGMRVDHKVEIYGREDDKKIGTLQMFTGTVVDETNSVSEFIRIDCYDDMYLFDVEFDTSGITYPIGLADLLNVVCRRIKGKPYKKTWYFDDSLKVEKNQIREGTTYRQFLIWLAEIMGAYVYADDYGELEIAYGLPEGHGENLRTFYDSVISKDEYKVRARIGTLELKSYTYDTDKESYVRDYSNSQYDGNYSREKMVISENQLITKRSIEAQRKTTMGGPFNYLLSVLADYNSIRGTFTIHGDPRLECLDTIFFFNPRTVDGLKITTITTTINGSTIAKSQGKPTSFKDRKVYSKQSVDRTEIYNGLKDVNQDVANTNQLISNTDKELLNLKDAINNFKKSIQHGIVSVNVEAEGVNTRTVTFPVAFSSTPTVVCTIEYTFSTALGIATYIGWQTADVTKTGFTLKTANNSNRVRNNVRVHWMAMA